MNKNSFIFLSLLLLLGCNKESVNWFPGTFEEALVHSYNENKIIMIDFYTDWWYACNLLDVNTFNTNNVSDFLNKNFINLKIDAETKIGQKLFSEFSGTAYPLILFLDKDKKELDRFYGFYEPEDFLNKIKLILEGKYTFPNLLKQFEAGDQSSETLSKLAKKYADRGENDKAINLYQLLLQSKNVSFEAYHESKYYIVSQKLWTEGVDPLKIYLTKNSDSPFFKDGVNQLLAFYKNTDTKKELIYYEKYLNMFLDDPWFLNQYAWRMAELNENLNNALDKVNMALTLLANTEKGYANIIDTKAELLWKMGKKNDAVIVINDAIVLEPENEYYQIQKDKFLESKN